MFGFLKAKEQKRGRGRPVGYIASEETKRKMSKGAKLAWQRRRS